MSTVLLIDDRKLLRRANELSLKKAGYQIIRASDGEEGLRHARERKPDVIVLDMMLAKLGGADFLQVLKGDPTTAKIPVIVLSSLPQKNEQKLVAAGAAAYLEKSSLALDQCSSELSRTIGRAPLFGGECFAESENLAFAVRQKPTKSRTRYQKRIGDVPGGPLRA